MTDEQEHEPDKRCIRPECAHAFSVHRDGGACRVTNCTCAEFAAKPKPAPLVQSRRVCIDVPDGYSLSMSLIPFTESEAHDNYVRVANLETADAVSGFFLVDDEEPGS